MPVKAIFILLGKSDLTWCQDPISRERLFDMNVAPVNCILGITIDMCHFTVGMLPDLLAEVTSLLCKTWGPHQRSFLRQEAKILTGKLKHIGSGRPWVNVLLGHI